MLFHSVLFLCCIQILGSIFGHLVLEFVAQRLAPQLISRKYCWAMLNGCVQVLNDGIATTQKSRTWLKGYFESLVQT